MYICIINIIALKHLRQKKQMKIVHFSKFFFLLSNIIFCISITSCDKRVPQPKVDEYYIKYEINSNTIYSGKKLMVEYLNEKNEYVLVEIPAKKNWEVIIGPVYYGYTAKITVGEIGTYYGNLTLGCQISCSKNNSPFALKLIDNENIPRNRAEWEYTIDY